MNLANFCNGRIAKIDCSVQDKTVSLTPHHESVILISLNLANFCNGRIAKIDCSVQDKTVSLTPHNESVIFKEFSRGI